MTMVVSYKCNLCNFNIKEDDYKNSKAAHFGGNNGLILSSIVSVGRDVKHIHLCGSCIKCLKRALLEIEEGEK